MYTSLIVFFVAAIGISFFCSMLEAVLLSTTHSYTQVKLNEGSRVGTLLNDYKNNIDRPLAAILTLNTIANTWCAIGVGKEASKIWLDYPTVTGLFVPLVMTACILIFSEITPKTIGANNWQRLAPFAAISLNIMLTVGRPIIWFLQVYTRLLNKNDERTVFSRADFLALAEIGSSEGKLDQVESRLIYNLLHFKNYQVKDVMTPRSVIVSEPEEMYAREFYDLQEDLIFSRILLKESKDSEIITGYILKDEVLEHLLDDEDHKQLKDFKRNIITVSETHSMLNMFNDFIKNHEHIALVIDEFNSVAGVVTMEDVVETILGTEIVDETDQVVDLQDLAIQQGKSMAKNTKD
jgi:CBS domain containing-hemolysin-like protein